MFNITKNTIEIGLEKPLKVLHITDSHLPFYCETDSEAMINQGKKRDEKSSVQNLKELMEYGEKSCDIIALTEPQIKAVLTGHLHFGFKSRLPGGCFYIIISSSYGTEGKE